MSGVKQDDDNVTHTSVSQAKNGMMPNGMAPNGMMTMPATPGQGPSMTQPSTPAHQRQQGNLSDLADTNLRSPYYEHIKEIDIKLKNNDQV